jgi:uncharacterized repeat protein (TIGR01451 family)
MSRRIGPDNTVYHASPRIWRVLMIAVGTLILCSCRGPISKPVASYPAGDPAAAPSPALPQEAYSGTAAAYLTAPPTVYGPPGMEAGVPLPMTVTGPWIPPGSSQPWPPDEYLTDGGDRGETTTVGREWMVNGLEPEDTVAHYDTLDGRRLVEPSNEVHIYSPRFGAVRQVVSLREDDRQQSLGDVVSPTKLVQHEDTLVPISRQQHLQAKGQIGRDLANIYRSEQGDGALSAAAGLRSLANDFKPFEDFAAIRQGIFEAPEMARLAQSVDAAMVWAKDQAVQVVLDERSAAAEVGTKRLSTVYTVKSFEGESKLRITKVASTGFAEPGDVVDFTLRFDNVGTELIGNVTILDNLTTRLEYVEGSAQCSLPAQFLTEPSQSDSLVLRWEITDPLPVGQGGVIRFRCRVR